MALPALTPNQKVYYDKAVSPGATADDALIPVDLSEKQYKELEKYAPGSTETLAHCTNAYAYYVEGELNSKAPGKGNSLGAWIKRVGTGAGGLIGGFGAIVEMNGNHNTQQVAGALLFIGSTLVTSVNCDQAPMEAMQEKRRMKTLKSLELLTKDTDKPPDASKEDYKRYALTAGQFEKIKRMHTQADAILEDGIIQSFDPAVNLLGKTSLTTSTNEGTVKEETIRKASLRNQLFLVAVDLGVAIVAGNFSYLKANTQTDFAGLNAFQDEAISLVFTLGAGYHTGNVIVALLSNYRQNLISEGQRRDFVKKQKIELI